MPRISEFYGIAIYLYYNDHAPPHFHAIYTGSEALIGIDPVRIIEGNLPRRASSLVIEWAGVHREELMANWLLAREHEPLQPIPPLD